MRRGADSATPGNGACYAEYEMNEHNDNPGWKTCLFGGFAPSLPPPAPLVCPPPVLTPGVGDTLVPRGGADVNFPDVDHGLVCADCKVLVDDFQSYGSCDEYCKSIGRTCVSAAEEQHDDCNVKYTMGCEENAGGVTSDALCECSPDWATVSCGGAEVNANSIRLGLSRFSFCDRSCFADATPSTPRPCSRHSRRSHAGDPISPQVPFPNIRDGVTCGDCRVLVEHFRTQPTG